MRKTHNSSGLQEKCGNRLFAGDLGVRTSKSNFTKSQTYTRCSTCMEFKLLSRNRRNTDMCFFAISSSVEPHIYNRKSGCIHFPPFLLLPRNLAPQLYDISNICIAIKSPHHWNFQMFCSSSSIEIDKFSIRIVVVNKNPRKKNCLKCRH